MPFIITIDGIIGLDVTAQDVRNQLKEAKGEPIEVQVSSVGGSVHEGIAIFNLIKAYRGEKSSRIIGLAASMGSYIALAAGEVAAEDNAVYMIHNSWGVVGGDYRDLKKYAGIFEKTTENLAKKYSEKTGKPLDEIRTMMDEETWFYGQEIVDAGFADKLESATKEGEASKEDAIIYAQLKIDECASLMKEKDKKEDLEKLAAYFKEEQPKQKGEVKMTLEEFLAQNPEAKAQYEAAIKPKEEPKAEVNENAQAYAVLESDSYSKAVKAVALGVVKGEKSPATLEAIVAFADMQKEQENSAQAQAETDQVGDTPGQQSEDTGLENGSAKSPKGISALASQTKEFVNPKKGDK